MLGDRDKRSQYDRSRALSAGRSSHSSTQARKESRRECHNDRYRATPPVPPNPLDFDIDSGYYEKAVEGARAWKKRRRLLPDALKAMIFIVFAGAGSVISVFGSVLQLAAIRDVAGFAWIVGGVVGYALSVGVQQLHDNHMLRFEFNPRYNPSPSAYAQFAVALAEYEAEIGDVHLTRTGSCYHSSIYCSGTMSSFALPRYEAKARGYRPCSHCGYVAIRTKLLPPPFGTGAMPEDDTKLA